MAISKHNQRTGFYRSILICGILITLLAPSLSSQTTAADNWPELDTYLDKEAWINMSPSHLRELLDTVPDPFRQRTQGTNALSYAAGLSKNPAIIDILIESGFHIEHEDHTGMTPLLIAAYQNTEVEILKKLIELGADCFARDIDGMNALMHAADMNMNAEIVTLIYDCGFDVNAQNSFGKTALMYAASSSNANDKIPMLLSMGADVNLRDNIGMTALMWAARDTGYPVVMQSLIEAGADVTAQDADGWDPLMWATYTYINKSDAVEILLDNDAPPDTRANDGTTALMLAAYYTYEPQTLRSLLLAGADPYATDSDDWTAYDYALENTALEDVDIKSIFNLSR